MKPKPRQTRSTRADATVPPPESDRRGHARVNVLLAAFLQTAALDIRELATLWMDVDGVLTLDLVPGRPSSPIQLVDLSATGLQAVATVPIPEQGCPLHIRLFARSQNRPVPITGRIIWKRPETAGSVRFGVAFDAIDDAATRLLERKLGRFCGPTS